jgi:hypothetical protein
MFVLLEYYTDICTIKLTKTTHMKKDIGGLYDLEQTLQGTDKSAICKIGESLLEMADKLVRAWEQKHPQEMHKYRLTFTQTEGKIKATKLEVVALFNELNPPKRRAEEQHFNDRLPKY